MYNIHIRQRQHVTRASPSTIKCLQHEGDVVVRDACAEVGPAELAALQHRVEAVAFPVQIAHEGHGSAIVVSDHPHLCKKQLKLIKYYFGNYIQYFDVIANL